MTHKTRFKIRVVALLSTAAGPSAVVTATLKRGKAEATFVLLDDRELTYLEVLVEHDNETRMISVPLMDDVAGIRTVLRGHAIDAETGGSPDEVEPFERAARHWPSGEPAWLHVEAWARYFIGHLLAWRDKHGGQRAPTGFTFNALRRLAVAAGHDPSDRDLVRLAETFDRLGTAEVARIQARTHQEYAR